MKGFDRDDFEVLRRMAATESGAGEDLAERADELWAKAQRLISQVGTELFGAEGFDVALWPDGDGERLPFLWARWKRRGNEGFATHVGLFLSPDHCNLAIDLEKDLLDADAARESLDQVLAFCRERLGDHLESAPHADIHVWTDLGNVVAAGGWVNTDFDRFMAANRDAGHPWPKVGYLFDAQQVQSFGDEWVTAMVDRAAPLVPVYDAMMRDFAA